MQVMLCITMADVVRHNLTYDYDGSGQDLLHDLAMHVR